MCRSLNCSAGKCHDLTKKEDNDRPLRVNGVIKKRNMINDG